MSTFAGIPAAFFPAFLAGMRVNFEIAGIALLLGIAGGMLLAAARYWGGVAGMAAGLAVGLMRAAPTFVVMFFLLNATPPGIVSPVMIVALSLVPYAAAYVADGGLDALRAFHAGSHLAAFLILPNIARAFFVLVMSSSAGAAIGVHEGIAIILQQAQKMPSTGGTLMLFAIGIVCFGIPLQTGFVAVRLLHRQLSRIAEHDPRRTLSAATGLSR
jgi:hypothetical protein